MAAKRFKPSKPHVPRFDDAVAGMMAREASVIAAREVRAFAQREARIMARKMEDQRFPSFKANPLAQSTLDKKRAAGRSLRVLRATGEMVGSIRVFVRSTPGGQAFRIGFHHSKLARDTVTGHPRQGVSMDRVARILEGGAPGARIPARPHWGVQRAIMEARSPAVRARILSMARHAMRRRLGFR